MTMALTKTTALLSTSFSSVLAYCCCAFCTDSSLPLHSSISFLVMGMSTIDVIEMDVPEGIDKLLL